MSGPAGAVLVEACVTTHSEARDAAASGADRLELCRDLSVDGLTPLLPVLAAVGQVGVPVFTMVRPRPGSFRMTADEVDGMVDEIRSLGRRGAAGVVVGALDDHGRIDAGAVEKLVTAAGALPVTFHRAFDLCSDQEAALEVLVDLGVARVLTGGGPGRAIDQRDGLARLVEVAAGRIRVIAAGGVRGDHAAELCAHTGVREVHARAEGIPGIVAALRG